MSYNTTSYATEHQIGEYAEYLFSDFCNGLGYGVTDCREIFDYHITDIDFIIKTPKAEKKVEVKGDNVIAKTNNLFLEWWNAGCHDNLGWFKFCKADCLAYIDVTNNILYLYDFTKLRDFCNGQPNKKSIDKKYNASQGNPEEIESKGYLLNKDLAFNAAGIATVNLSRWAKC